MSVKGRIRPLPGVRRLSLLRQRATFNDSASFWERKYVRGDTSGPGSYGALANAKAKFLNSFVCDYGVMSVAEFGCGDGHQLELANYPSYIGLDVSRKAIEHCKSRFAADLTKSFFLYSGDSFVDNHRLFAADLALSLDVIYHLVEDRIFESYMRHLFGAGNKYVIIYSTDMVMTGTAPHVRHRRFSPWVDISFPQWKLARVEKGANPERARADFYVYERTAD